MELNYASLGEFQCLGNKQGLYSFDPFKFHDSMTFPMTLVLAATLEIFKTILILVIVFFPTDVIQFRGHNLWCPPKRTSYALFYYVSLPYFVLALISAVTNLPNITSNFP